MGFITAVGLWLALFGVVLFVMLFGESEMFQGTPVEQLHWLITDGLCVGCSWVLKKIVGRAAGERVEAALGEFFDRPNPAMQLVYASLVMGGYWVFCVHAYDLIGGDGEGALSTWHRRAIPVAMLISIASWLATCWSDPGTVDARTLDAHLAAYPFDNVLYSPKLCPTLKVTCPARSKYCRVTRRRVGKFDHFCGWMNNAIGENNLRYFVSFLALHVALTSYGAWLCFAVIRGEISRRGLWGVAFEGPGARRRRSRAIERSCFGSSCITSPRSSCSACSSSFSPSCSARSRLPRVDDRRGRDHERDVQDQGLPAKRAATRRGRGRRGMEPSVGREGDGERDGRRPSRGVRGGDVEGGGRVAGRVGVDDVSSRGRGSPASIHILASSRTPHTAFRHRLPQGVSNQSLGGVLSSVARAHPRRLDAMAKAGKRGGVDASKKSRSIR